MFRRLALHGFQAFGTYVVAPALSAVAAAKKFAMSYIPSYVVEVLVVNTEHATPQILPVYRAIDYYYSWHRAHATTAYLTDADQYYVVTVWNAQSTRYESYFLSSKHLCRALGVRTVGTWWAFSDYGIATLLAAYVTSMKKLSYGIYDFRIGTEYAGETLREVHASLEIPDNISARALCAYYEHLKGRPATTAAATATTETATATEEAATTEAADSDSVDTADVFYKATDPPAAPASHPIAVSETSAAASAASSEMTAAAPTEQAVPPTVVVINYELDEWECRGDAPIHAL